jgi:RNA methyltransferase, TrmH family
MPPLKNLSDYDVNALKRWIPERKQLRSAANPTVKEWSSALQAKEWMVLEGLHLVQMYSHRYGLPPMIIVSSEAAIPQEIMDWLHVHQVDTPLWLLHASVAKKLSSLGTVPPILALAPLPNPSELPLELAHHSSLWLDGIQDPGNAGTLIRTALGAGIKHIVFGKGSVACWSPKVLRAAQGAHFHVQLWQDMDLLQLTQALPSLPKWGASPRGKAYETMLWTRPMALVLGNEGQGLSSELESRLDGSIGIFLDTALESLNVAVAGAILMFEWRRCCPESIIMGEV